MVFQTQLQQGIWHNHQGGNIGGVAPRWVSFDAKSKAPSSVFALGGNTQPGKIPMVDWYIETALSLTAHNLSLGYDLIVDQNVAANAWALERDVKLTHQGKTANFSFECVVAEGWKLQISKQGGGWVDLGASIAPLTPDVVHHFLHRYLFDLTKWTYSYLSVNIDGEEYSVPNQLQNLPFEQTNWGDGAIFQFQQDLRPDLQNPTFSETLNNADLTWW